MRPNDGDIVIMTFGKERTYYGVIRRQDSLDNCAFVAYSAEADQYNVGHRDGDTGHGKGHWFTIYNEITGFLDSNVTLMTPPRRKTVPIGSMNYVRTGLRVTLSAKGRLIHNVRTEHGGPYGTGRIVEVGRLNHSVRWDTGPVNLYFTDLLDAVVPEMIQRNMWEESWRT